MTTEAPPRPVVFKLRGGNLEMFEARDREMLVEGPRGTGKTFAILTKLYRLAFQHPGFKGLIVRKHAVTLTTTCLRTFDEQVRQPNDGVSFFGGSKSEPAAYRFPNGSLIIGGGMGDKEQSDKVKSSEYDLIYANEATELSIDDWEALLPLLRHMDKEGQPIIRDQRIIADCNPSSSSHWLNRRCNTGKTRRITTDLRDNPAFYNDVGEILPMGEKYISETLEGLTGSRRQRWLLGEWTGVENAIYPHFDRELHVRPLEPGLIFQTGAIGADYGRRHNASVVPVRVDQYGRRWVFKAWAQPDRQHGRESEREIAQQRERYSISRLRVGPDMDIMIGLAGGEKSRIAEGSRQARTIEVAYLMGVFPGGLVPSSRDDAYNAPPAAVTTRPDSPGLLFVEGGYGIEELCEEIENYHEVFVQSERAEQYVVARINDDRVSALEYACEELKDLSYFDFSIFAQGLGLATR